MAKRIKQSDISRLSRRDLKVKPEFENVRRNNEEFRIAAKTAKGMRDAANRLLFKCPGQTKIKYLTTQIYKNIRETDTKNGWGERVIQFDQLDSYMTNMELGEKNRLSTAFLSAIDYDFINGNWRVQFGRHNSATDIVPPNGTTHYSLASGMIMQTAQEFGFCCSEHLEPVGIHPITGGQVNRLEFILPTPPQAIGNFRMFIAAIHFWRYENGRFYPINDGKHNAARIIGIES